MPVTLPDDLKDALDGPNFASLATLNEDGSPHNSTMWVERDGDRIVFNTVVGRVKWRNMSRDPRVSVTTYSADNPYSQHTVIGRVVEMTEEGAENGIDRLAAKYLGVERYEWRQPGQVRVRVVVDADRVATH